MSLRAREEGESFSVHRWPVSLTMISLVASNEVQRRLTLPERRQLAQHKAWFDVSLFLWSLFFPLFMLKLICTMTVCFLVWPRMQANIFPVFYLQTGRRFDSVTLCVYLFCLVLYCKVCSSPLFCLPTRVGRLE